MKLKLTLKSLAMVLGLIGSTFAGMAQDEKVDTLNVHEQRITSLEDGLFQLKKLKFSGYIQAEWQSSQLDSTASKSNDMKVGNALYGPEKAIGGIYNRYGIRRGRLKATYEDFGCKGVIEFDISEGGLKTKDVYLSVLDPWVNVFTVKGGVFDNPFGYEIAYSSSSLESPERSRIIQTLFPDEKTMGGMLTIQAPKTSPWNVLKLDAGFVAGNAINKDYKSTKDFVAHLTYSNSTPVMKYGIGASVYSGFVYNTSQNVYTMQNGAFARDSSALVVDPTDATKKLNLNSKSTFSNRTYYGLDGQLSFVSDLGMSQLRAEYIFGTQPGTASSTASLNGYDASTATATDAYVRNFNGGYVQFVQDIADTQHSITVKYDWYNPNTDINSSAIGATLTTDQIAANKLTPNTSKPYMAANKADMSYSTIGLGYIYRMNNNVKLTVYYDMVSNGKTQIKKYMSDLADNVLTVRLQYKF